VVGVHVVIGATAARRITHRLKLRHGSNTSAAAGRALHALGRS
jgi:hypothetical protein